MRFLLPSLFLLNLVFRATGYDLRQVTFVIMSQQNKRDASIAEETEQRLIEKLRADGVESPQVFGLHDDLPLHGGWTIFPLLTTLKSMAKPETKWFAFLHDTTEVELELFKAIPAKYTTDYEIFVGHSLVDKEISIIHHFDSSKLAYPDFKAGFLLSRKLLETLAKHLEDNPDSLAGFPRDFSIDASYEFAKGELQDLGLGGLVNYPKTKSVQLIPIKLVFTCLKALVTKKSKRLGAKNSLTAIVA